VFFVAKSKIHNQPAIAHAIDEYRFGPILGNAPGRRELDKLHAHTYPGSPSITCSSTISRLVGRL
jgi:hypothetical protein